LKAETVTVLDVITDPGAHPPISLYDGTLDHATPFGRAAGGSCVESARPLTSNDKCW
jgi:hypothetical protein